MRHAGRTVGALVDIVPYYQSMVGGNTGVEELQGLECVKFGDPGGGVGVLGRVGV